MPGPLANPAVSQVHRTSGARLTPTPQRQSAFVGATFGVAAVGAMPPGVQVRLLNRGVKAYAALIAMGDAYPALGPNQKLAVRYGGSGKVTTLAKAVPITRMYGVGPRHTPFPDLGFGFTAVPNTSSRWVYEMNKSRPGENTSSSQVVSGPLKTRKTMRGASALKRGRSGPSSQKPRGMISRANRRGPATSRGRRPRTVRYRKGGCPPGYRYDRRRKMCVLTK